MNYSEELRKRLEEEDIADWHGLMQKPEVIWALLREIDRLNAERRWIPVSEPPNTDGLYLASLDNGGVEIVEYWLGGWMMKLDEDWTRTELLTHWMPLPPAPESEG